MPRSGFVAVDLPKLKWIFTIPVAMASAAAGLFFLQGGFAGGHGRYDRLIGLLGLPAIWVIPMAGTDSDLQNVILLPGIANLLLWLAGLAVVRSVLRRR